MKYLLGFVFTLFIGIMVFVYLEAKKANPVMLDEKGKPMAATSGAR